MSAAIVWGLETRKRDGSEGWRTYYAMYPTLMAAEIAAARGKPKYIEWRVVEYVRSDSAANPQGNEK